MNEDFTFIGKNIRFFRRSKNWTLDRLASKVGIKSGPLGRIERGVNLPSAAVIYRLTHALGITADALFASDFSQVRVAAADTDSLFVTLEPDPAAPPKNLLFSCHEIMAAFHALEDILGVQKYSHIPLSIPFEANYKGIDQLAIRFRNYLGARDAVIFDYLELFENFGLRVILFPFMKNADDFGGLSFYEPQSHNAFFFINSRNNPEKQLFSLAQELGKILIFNQMRNTKISLFPHEDTGSDNRAINESRAAKRFAAIFLMPEATVRATVSQLGITETTWSWELLLRIKHRFGISSESFLYRLDELGLISNKLVEKFQARIKEHYHQTGFAEPDSSRRILNANGRFFDLLLTAKGVESARQEVTEIEKMVREKRIIQV